MLTKAIRTSTPGQVLDLPMPPDQIIVDIKPVKGIKWPQGLSLSHNSNLIQILTMLTSQCKKKVKVGTQELGTYYAHAVDLAFAITVWKCQWALLTISLPCSNTHLVVQLSPLRKYM
jgi:hypothetical protein